MTEEMLKIINSKDKHIVIQAPAGSAKSYTMNEYIKAHPTEKILFLVYNKEMQMDFARRLKGVNHNAKIQTIHSLAFNWYVSKYGKKMLKNINTIEISNLLKLDKRKDIFMHEVSTIKFYFDMFLLSNKDIPEDLQVIEQSHTMYLKYVRQLWDIFSSENPPYITHSVYLKMYQLEKVKLDYETILVDEFNDASAVMVDLVINNMDKKIIVVGDTNQNICSFAHTVDGLAIVRDIYGFKEYKLTMSFRISDNIANLCSRFLTWSTGNETKFNGSGKTTLGKLNLMEASKTNQIHLLCRTKIGGLMELIELFNLGFRKKIYFIGGSDNFGFREMDKLLQFNGFIYIGGKKFSVNYLRQMLNNDDSDSKDPEIQRIVSLYDFAKKNKIMLDILRNNEVTKKEEADIIILTFHVSKGLTLENVKIGRDFKPVENLAFKYKECRLDDEHEYIINTARSELLLLYVAMSRATNILDLNGCLTKQEKLTKEDKLDLPDELCF